MRFTLTSLLLLLSGGTLILPSDANPSFIRVHKDGLHTEQVLTDGTKDYPNIYIGRSQHVEKTVFSFAFTKTDATVRPITQVRIYGARALLRGADKEPVIFPIRIEGNDLCQAESLPKSKTYGVECQLRFSRADSFNLGLWPIPWNVFPLDLQLDIRGTRDWVTFPQSVFLRMDRNEVRTMEEGPEPMQNVLQFMRTVGTNANTIISDPQLLVNRFHTSWPAEMYEQSQRKRGLSARFRRQLNAMKERRQRADRNFKDLVAARYTYNYLKPNHMQSRDIVTESPSAF